MADFFWFSDDQWSRIEPLLPVNGKGARRVDDRRVLSGIVHALQSGGRWGDCPPIYGPKKTLYNRFVRWAERGIWEGIFSALAGADGVPDRLFIDSTCIKAHRTAGGAKGGLGQWYRPDTWWQKQQGSRHLRRERQTPCPDDNSRKCARYAGR
jgi:mannitol 2-dehydrogenase